MAGQWVDDPSWGGVVNGLFDVGKPGQAQLAAEHIRALQLKRAMDEATFAAENAAVNASRDRYAAMQPPRFLVNPNAGAPYQGGVGDVIANNVPPTTALGDDPWLRQRAQARADEELATRLSKTPAQIAQTRGLGQVTMGGVPTDPAEFARVQTMLEGKMPTAEGKTPHNWVVLDSNGQPSASGMTFDGRTIAGTRQLMPPNAILAGPANVDPASPLANKEKAIGALGNLAIDVNSGNRNLTTNPFSRQDIERIHVMTNAGYPESFETVDMGGGKQGMIVRKASIPTHLHPIMDQLNQYLRMMSGAPPGVTEGGDQPVAPAPTARPPIVDQRVVSPYQPNTIAPQQLATAAREDPVIKKYDENILQWNGMVPVANGGGSEGVYTNASDLSLIYGVARIFDDRTGVRDAELNLQQGIGTIGMTLQAIKQRFVDNGGILPPEVRRELMYAAEIRMRAYDKAFEAKQREYSDKAKLENVDPRRILPYFPGREPLDLKAMRDTSARTVAGTTPQQQPPGPTPVIPPRAPAALTPQQLLQGGP